MPAVFGYLSRATRGDSPGVPVPWGRDPQGSRVSALRQQEVSLLGEGFARRRHQPRVSAPSTRPPSDPPPRATPAIHHTGPPTALPVAPGAGAEPQTRTLPSTDSVAFRHAMTDLW